MTDVAVPHFATHTPSLEELVLVLSVGLRVYFEDVKVDLVDCPNFEDKPYKLSVQGLHGKPSIVDVGGVHNLIPHVNLQSHYNLTSVTKAIFKDESDYPISVFGPGGAAYYDLGYCAEFMGSAKYEKNNGEIKTIGCACRYAYVKEDTEEGRWEDQTDDKFGLMGNFYLSQNKKGKVLKVRAKKRLSKENFTEAIRAVLLRKYGESKPVSMGGVFLINSGTAKLHIMPKHWPEEPSTDESVNNGWLRYYNITKHPLVCLSVFHSHDPGYDLRMEHTHCFNLDTNDEAGHYHYDTTPETVEYEGYFNVAEQVYRYDGPQRK